MLGISEVTDSGFFVLPKNEQKKNTAKKPDSTTSVFPS